MPPANEHENLTRHFISRPRQPEPPPWPLRPLLSPSLQNDLLDDDDDEDVHLTKVVVIVFLVVAGKFFSVKRNISAFTYCSSTLTAP